LISILKELKQEKIINLESLVQLQTKILTTIGESNVTDQLMQLMTDYYALPSFGPRIIALSCLIKWEPSNALFIHLTFSTINFMLEFSSSLDQSVSLSILVSRLKYLTASEELIHLLNQLLEHNSELVRKAAGEVLSTLAHHN